MQPLRAKWHSEFLLPVLTNSTQPVEFAMHSKCFSSTHAPLRERGVTLIELMVGIAIGLLTIAVALGALIASRGVSGTTSDASQLQQQASYVFRVIGQQARQAASIQLNLAIENAAPTDPITPEAAVAFTPDDKLYSSDGLTPPSIFPISGKDAPGAAEYKLSLAYQDYPEALFPAGGVASQFRDCLGQSAPAAAPTVVQSQFKLDTTQNELQCLGSGNPAPQAIARNVADFAVSYLVQDDLTAVRNGLPTVRIMNAAGVGANWQRVFGVEVCITLYGDEAISMPNGSTYLKCDGTTENMSTTGTLGTKRKNRMHMTFKSVFQIRSQGQPTNPNA